MKEIVKVATIAAVLSLLFGLGMVNHAQAEYISTLQTCIASRDSLINKLLNDMELIYLEK